MKKKTDEVGEDNDETIAILTEHQGLKTRLKDNEVFQILLSSCVSLKPYIHAANERNWYAKQY